MSTVEPTSPRPLPPPGEPYCRVCGYHLKGLTESTKCPECGGALVEVLVRANAGRGKRWQSQAKWGDWPLVSIASGPAPGEKYGHPRGVIAIGDFPVGFVAIGLVARGFIALGTVAFGFFAMGSGAVGVLALGAVAAGGCACGAVAIGFFALGPVAIYLIKGFGVVRILLWR